MAISIFYTQYGSQIFSGPGSPIYKEDLGSFVIYANNLTEPKFNIILWHYTPNYLKYFNLFFLNKYIFYNLMHTFTVTTILNPTKKIDAYT